MFDFTRFSMPPASDPLAPLYWARGNLHSLSRLVLADLKRPGADEEALLMAFFSLLKAKQAIHSGMAGVAELQAGRSAA